MVFLLTAKVFLFSSIAIANTGASLEEILKPLGGIGKADSCPYSRDTLVKYSMQWGFAPLRQYWACVMLRKNLNRDSKSSCRPNTADALATPIDKNEKNLRGTLAYLGIAPMPYRYGAGLRSNETPVVKVSVYFKGSAANRANLALIQAKMNSASRIWEAGSLKVKHTEFQFRVAESELAADFSVNLQEADTRGPYLRRWSLNWSSNTIAHELGHMMGLDDEYDNFRVSVLGRSGMPYEKLMRCDPGSIMCSSSYGAPQPHHYYAILRRRGC
ncbi:MAG: hypothetical protein JNL01_01600 [Bdellovibrionales bacterium]|nr:hypothetical protein [Bdellovibrionales bacterium]